MKKIILFFFSLFFGIALFIGAIKYIGWSKIWAVFQAFSFWQAIVILGLTGLILFIGAWKWKVILKSQGFDLSFKKIFKSFLVGYTIDFLTPITVMGGEMMRAYTLKEQGKQENQNSSWEKILSSIVVDKILDFTLMFGVVLAGIAYFDWKFSLPFINSKSLFALPFILAAFILTLFYLKASRRESLIKFFVKLFKFEKSRGGEMVLTIEKEMFKFFKSKIVFQKALFLSMAKISVFFVRHWLLIYFLGLRFGFLETLSALTSTFLAFFVPIPALLGSHEIIQSFVFGAISNNPGAGTAFTLILRMFDLVFVFWGLIFVFRFGVEYLFFKLIHNFINGFNNSNHQQNGGD